jgi:hypothetical protein
MVSGENVSAQANRCSLSHHLYDHPLIAPAIEFGVKDALPWAKVQPSGSNGNDNFVVDQQRLEVRIAVGLAGIVMAVVFAEWRQLLEPLINVFYKPSLIIIHVNAGGDVHGRNQHHAFFHSALLDDRFNLRRDVKVFPVIASMEFQVFGVKFHGDSIITIRQPSRGEGEGELSMNKPGFELRRENIGAIRAPVDGSVSLV